jgi:hypothetical protein
MAFSLPANINFQEEQAAANARPLIRLFTVGTADGALAAPGEECNPNLNPNHILNPIRIRTRT